MRIVIATDLYLPVHSGVAQFAQNLAIELAKHKHEVLVIAPSQKGRKFQEKEFGYTVARVTSLRVPFVFMPRIAVNPVLEVKRLLNDFKPDVVHIQTPLPIGVATRNASRKLGIPIVSTNHGLPENIVDNIKVLAPVASQASALIREYGVWFYGKDKVDYITMPTQSAIDIYKEQKAGVNVPVKAVSCGIDLSRFSPGKPDAKVARKYGIPYGKKQIVLYAGRLDSEKHLSVLVDAFDKIRKTNDVHLLISGGGNDEAALKEQVEALGIQQHVSFPGRVTPEELPHIYRMGDVFIMPSPAELQSIVTMEAMATGLPLVVVDAGAVHELCDETVNGYVCKTDDPSDMAAKIMKILGNDSVRKDMAKASLRLIKRHDIRETTKVFESIYKEVVGVRAKRSVTQRLKTPV